MFKKPLFIALTMVLIAPALSIAQIKRTPLQTVDFPPGFNVVSAIAEIPAGSCAGRHTHPGVESSYIMDGSGIIKIAGKPDQMVKAGDSFQIPANAPHDACAGAGASIKVLAYYIVEKGKPLATPAPE
jgi:quercetin dioxygenase-like cupin family protein